MPWLIWQKFGYQNHKIILRTVVPISPAGGDGGQCSTRKVFDRESVRQFRVSLGWVLSDNFRVGQLPASHPGSYGSNSNYSMFCPKRLGSVPSPSSHCCVGHSFGGRGLSNGAPPICTACTVYSFGGGVGIVVLADSRRQVLPGGPVPSLFKLRQGVWRCKNLNGYDLFYYIF